MQLLLRTTRYTLKRKKKKELTEQKVDYRIFIKKPKHRKIYIKIHVFAY